MPSGNLSHSMRDNYNTHGVSEYYKIVQESYRNPHFPGLKKVLALFMDQYVAQERPQEIKVLDLAAGSGEATIAINDWYTARWPSAPAPTPPAPSNAPSASASEPSTSPPSPSTAAPAPAPVPTPVAHPLIRLRQPFIPPSRAAARPSPISRPSASCSSSPSSAPPLPRPTLHIVAADPYTQPAYEQRTGRPCLPLSFSDVAAGGLPPPSAAVSRGGSTEGAGEGGEKAGEDEGEGEQDELYDLVVVSFALHLVESPSELWALLAELAKRARWLVVTAPHKKPDIKPTWSWRRWDPSPSWQSANEDERAQKMAAGRGAQEGDGFEIVRERVRLRVWRSEVWWEGE
ncbi:hypothetical protein JCM10207_008385 [Rhodosporidiobolus poonsookiae]